MQRDRRLRGLSSEHHQALVLARRLSRSTAWTAEDGEALGRRFDAELAPHFCVEEEVLLPALERLGETALVERTRADHAYVRSAVAAARGGDGDAARALGERLSEHVRFEERELFPRCEALLADPVLDEVARRAPKDG